MTVSSDQRDDADEPKLDGSSQTRESAGSDSNEGGEASDESSASSEEFESWLREAAQADPPSQVALPEVGQVISDKYRIEEELGRGGMGAVYRATHVVSHKPVALKWMLRSASDERARERFTREARAAGRIDHPNVVDVYDIGEDADAAYLVMELLRGDSLRRRLRSGPLEPSEAVDLLLPAMRGVAAANHQGVIHRDLKPDNIFLCVGPDGEPREAKVLDFGISTINEPSGDSQPTLTKEGTLLGTPAYMSPEQLENPRALNARADVYALGVILYECLTGKLPFEADNYSALVLAIAKGNPAPPRQHRPELSAELEAVVLRALSQERFETVDELIEALLPFSTLPSESRLSQTSVALPIRKSRVPLAVALGLVVAFGVGLWLLRNSAPQDSAEEPTAEVPAAEVPTGKVNASPETAESHLPGAATAASAPTEEPRSDPSATATSSPTGAKPIDETAAKSEPAPALTQRQPSRPAPAPHEKAPAPKATPKPQTPGRSGSISPEDL